MIRRRSAQHIVATEHGLLPHPVKLGLLVISMFVLTLVVTLAPAADGQGAAVTLHPQRQLIDTSQRVSIGAVAGLGDLSHASVVYSRDSRYGYVFGRDGGLTKVDLPGSRCLSWRGPTAGRCGSISLCRTTVSSR